MHIRGLIPRNPTELAVIVPIALVPSTYCVEMRRFESSGLEVIKLEYSLRLKIKCNDCLLADTCPQATSSLHFFESETVL